MSATDSLNERVDGKSWPRWRYRNTQGTFTTLLRPPRRGVARPSTVSMVVAAGVAVAAVVVSMLFLDARAIAADGHIAHPIIIALDFLTDGGWAGMFLWPIGIVLVVLAALDTPVMPRFARLVLAACAVRFGFIFTAIALPSLLVSIVKRLIGRARPSMGDGVWSYHPFTWNPGFASMPSGHSTTAFAALVAIGAVVPQARAPMWTYAIMIVVSRVVLEAHYPSDIIAGAVVGVVGALAVRHWFAARRLGFAVGPDGSIRPMPGPTWRRIVKAVVYRAPGRRP